MTKPLNKAELEQAMQLMAAMQSILPLIAALEEPMSDTDTKAETPKSEEAKPAKAKADKKVEVETKEEPKAEKPTAETTTPTAEDKPMEQTTRAPAHVNMKPADAKVGDEIILNDELVTALKHGDKFWWKITTATAIGVGVGVAGTLGVQALMSDASVDMPASTPVRAVK